MRFRLLVLGLLVLAIVPLPGGEASASCAAPRLEVVGQEATRTPVLHRGESFVVKGRYFVDGCNDTGIGDPGGLGCSGGNDTRPAVKGLEHLRLHLVHGTVRPTQLELGTSDADDHGRVVWHATVPPGAPTGSSNLKSELSEPLEVTIRP